MSEFVYVYRLEHKDTGIGPFQGLYCLTLDDTTRQAWLAHTKQHNRELDARQDELYGVLSEQSIVEYFGSFLPGLLNSGYEIGVYYIPNGNIRYGTLEVVFRP